MLSGARDQGQALAPKSLALLLALAAFGVAAASAEAAENRAPGEVVDRTALRVCADPADLPFSNEAEEGFENEVAQLLADHLQRPLTYIWYPRTVGFIRQTLRARLCDLVMGIVSATDLVQNTNPYYRSTYVMAVREEDAEDLVGEAGDPLSSPILRQANIGVVAGTPPGDLLARRGILNHLRSYYLHHDSRHTNPLRQMVEDLDQGLIDVAMGWGPSIGYWAGQAETPLRLVPLVSDDPRLRMDYRISMGIRWGEPEWKHEINNALAELQPEITRILQSYHIPLLDDRGQLIGGAAVVSVDPTNKVARVQAAEDTGGERSPLLLPPVEEPLGYRHEQYRAAVPATLEGGTVVNTNTLLDLINSENPVLIDVLPKQRQPEGRSETLPWMEKKRYSLPGATWLPNTGYGELSKEFEDYLRTHLERLTDGDRTHAVVFYCDANCWMSYNAAKRAILELDYTNVYWYPEGADGWQAEGHELVELHEETMPEFVR